VSPEYKMTPMMVQWHACKKTAGDALLLFRMGDFYEAFYEDAARISKELDLTLTTSRDSDGRNSLPHVR
jgi:DNA mismatch repair protein MutS